MKDKSNQATTTAAPPTFTEDDLASLVFHSGVALRTEDYRLREQYAESRFGSSDRTPTWGSPIEAPPIRDYYPGITDVINERDYQLIIWRCLTKRFRWYPRMEVKNSNGEKHDLVFYDDHTDEQVAVAEIKYWWGGSAGPVHDDVRKLTGLNIPSIMLVLTSYVKDEANPFEKLANELQLPHFADLDLWETHCFEIWQWPKEGNNWHDYKREFAVAGFFVTPPEDGTK